jgi:hypothetical protein
MLTAVFLVSASTLAFEVLLARVFAVTQWNHLSFLVISIALFGLAASGTFLNLWKPSIEQWRQVHGSLLVIFFSLSLLAATVGLNRIPLDYHRLILEPVQALYLLAIYLLLGLPFFFCGALTVVAYMALPQRSGLIYCTSMAGSAAGVLLPVAFLPIASESTLVIAGALAPLIAPGIMLTADWRRLRRGPTACFRSSYLAATTVGTLALAAGVYLLTPAAQGIRELKPSEFKLISQVRSFPDTQVATVAADIRGRVERVDSPHLRFAPGLSLKYSEPLPPAAALLTDGDRPVYLYDRSAAVDRFARATLAYAGYAVVGRPKRVLVLLSGGGLAVPCALASGAERILLIHPNPHVADRLRRHYGLPVLAENSRSYLARSSERFDVLHVESWGTALPGADALDQDHALTREAFEQYLERLTPDGVLIVSRRLRLPPADSLRLWSTAREALTHAYAPDPPGAIVILRSWDSFTLLVFRRPRPDHSGLLETARRYNFDVVYASHSDESLSNRFHVFDEPYYYREHRRLEQATAEFTETDYFRDYVLDAAPQSDRRPFPNHFLKWSRLPDLYRMLGRRLHAFGWSGEMLVAVTLAEATLVSAVLLVMPAWVAGRKAQELSWRPTLFFFSIGAGFMLAELLFIYLGVFLLGDPVISLTLTLAGLLVSSALGGFVSDRGGLPLLRIAVAAAAVVFMLSASALMLAAPHMLAWTAWARGGVLLAVVMLTGAWMGVPLPLALRKLAPHPSAKSYAWAANGCASVLASILSAQIAIGAGFEWIACAAVLSYGTAFLSLLRMRERT